MSESCVPTMGEVREMATHAQNSDYHLAMDPEDYDRALAAHNRKVAAWALKNAANVLDSGSWPFEDYSGVRNATRELRSLAERAERGEA